MMNNKTFWLRTAVTTNNGTITAVGYDLAVSLDQEELQNLEEMRFEKDILLGYTLTDKEIEKCYSDELDIEFVNLIPLGSTAFSFENNIKQLIYFSRNRIGLPYSTLSILRTEEAFFREILGHRYDDVIAYLNILDIVGYPNGTGFADDNV